VSTTEALQRRAEASSDESEEESEDDEPQGKANGKGPKGGKQGGTQGGGKGKGEASTAARWALPAEGGAVPHSELQARLRAKIEAARGLRKAEERKEAAAAAKAWRGKATAKTPSKPSKPPAKGAAHAGGKPKPAEAKGKDGAAAAGADGVMVSRVDSGHGSKGNAKKLSKKAQLHKAEAVQVCARSRGWLCPHLRGCSRPTRAEQSHRVCCAAAGQTAQREHRRAVVRTPTALPSPLSQMLAWRRLMRVPPPPGCTDGRCWRSFTRYAPNDSPLTDRLPTRLLGSFLWYRPGPCQCRFRIGYIGPPIANFSPKFYPVAVKTGSPTASHTPRGSGAPPPRRRCWRRAG
jgi:hypothetical protein